MGLLSAAMVVQAQERFEFYQGIRQMGMGGAATAVVNDETSLLLNPAGLGKLRDYIITVVDPEISITTTTQPILGTNATAPLDPQAMLDLLNQHPDTQFHSKAQIFPSLVVPNFGIGLLGKYQVDAKVDSATNMYRLDYTNDYALVMGYNFRLFSGILKLGFNAKAINRTEIHSTVASTSTGLTVPNMGSSGLGIGSDVGMILTAPWVWLPTLSGVVRDVGGTTFNAGSGLTAGTSMRPATVLQTIDAGFSISPILANRVRSVFTAEMRDVTNAYKDTDSMKRYHAGMEINFADAFFIRGGYNQRYWTAGLEFDVGHYQVQFATYGVEIGTATVPVEDRRYDMKLGFRF